MDKASTLFAIAGIYSGFDSKRITDETAKGGRSILIMETFAHFTDKEKEAFIANHSKLVKDPVFVKTTCATVNRIGMPNYQPIYLILHGMGMFLGKTGSGIDETVDQQKIWDGLLESYLHC